MLSVSWDTIRLFLHVLAATVWVGGQITLAALVPVLRRLGAEIPRTAARRFNLVAWPAFGVLIITGIWNIAAVHAQIHGDRSAEYAGGRGGPKAHLATSLTWGMAGLVNRGGGRAVLRASSAGETSRPAHRGRGKGDEPWPRICWSTPRHCARRCAASTAKWLLTPAPASTSTPAAISPAAWAMTPPRSARCLTEPWSPSPGWATRSRCVRWHPARRWSTSVPAPGSTRSSRPARSARAARSSAST